MKTLYELVGDQLELYGLLSDEDYVDENGVLNPRIQELLHQGEQDIKRKAIKYAIIIKQLESEAEAIKKEKMALAERQSRRENNAKRLTEYLTGNLLAAGITDKISDPKADIWFKKSKRVEVPNESIISKKYFNITRKLNKELLKKDLSAGIKIKGAALVEHQNLQIK